VDGSDSGQGCLCYGVNPGVENENEWEDEDEKEEEEEEEEEEEDVQPR
jgi:hypothetical protein